MMPARFRLGTTLSAAAFAMLPAALAAHVDFAEFEDRPVYIAADCPPGLAKKSPSCIPPGQARKAARGDEWYIDGEHIIGRRLDGGYVILDNPRRYGLDPDRLYYRVGDNIYLVDSDTREVLNFIGAAARLLD